MKKEIDRTTRERLVPLVQNETILPTVIVQLPGSWSLKQEISMPISMASVEVVSKNGILPNVPVIRQSYQLHLYFGTSVNITPVTCVDLSSMRCLRTNGEIWNGKEAGALIEITTIRWCSRTNVGLSWAPWQLGLAEKSSILTLLVDPFGCFGWLQLPFRLKVFDEFIQKCLIQILDNLNCVIWLSHEVYGTPEEHIKDFLERCVQHGMSV